MNKDSQEGHCVLYMFIFANVQPSQYAIYIVKVRIKYQLDVHA